MYRPSRAPILQCRCLPQMTALSRRAALPRSKCRYCPSYIGFPTPFPPTVTSETHVSPADPPPVHVGDALLLRAVQGCSVPSAWHSEQHRASSIAGVGVQSS